MGGRFHPKLNIDSRPIANKYHEGKVKRTLKRGLKVPEIVKEEGSMTFELAVDWIASSFAELSFVRRDSRPAAAFTQRSLECFWLAVGKVSLCTEIARGRNKPLRRPMPGYVGSLYGLRYHSLIHSQGICWLL